MGEEHKRDCTTLCHWQILKGKLEISFQIPPDCQVSNFRLREAYQVQLPVQEPCTQLKFSTAWIFK